ncbi:MAG: DNA N-6-adenine-methyltransferase [Candidatus Cryosericum sp.]
MTEPAQNKGRSKQTYCTPSDFFAAVVARWGSPVVDLAASQENTVAPVFVSEQRDSLDPSVDWPGLTGAGLAWLNPPFGNLSPWAAKCRLAARSGNLKGRILMLVPSSTGTVWWADYVHEYAIIHLLRPRICFDGENPYPKDLALLEWEDIFQRLDKKRNPPDYRLWKWKEPQDRGPASW